MTQNPSTEPLDAKPPVSFRFAARSHTGLIRSNNQDSGYAGPNFLLVADGMGGHAGGDVASAITVSHLSPLDGDGNNAEAATVLEQSILEANQAISARVQEHSELAGMGTTVTGLLRSGNTLVLAHIGDSRAYLLRDGAVHQATSDHTFVQLLVDEGRITPEEAENHPQRSVVMRVLGDVGSEPELDISVHDAQLGDRWMLCSDGLTGFAPIDRIKKALKDISDPDECAAKLVDFALEGGGADNVTVVIGDIVPGGDGAEQSEKSVGSVALNPQYATSGPVDKHSPASADPTAARLSSLGAASADASGTEAAEAESAAQKPPAAQRRGSKRGHRGSHAQQDTKEIPTGERRAGADERDGLPPTPNEDYPDDEADLEDWGRKPRRRPFLGLFVTLIVLVLLAAGGVAAWSYTQNQYYVATEDTNVAIYRGVSQTLGPLSLSTVEESTAIPLSDLSDFSRKRVEQTIPASSLDDANRIVETLQEEAADNVNKRLQAGASSQTTDDPVPTPGASAPAEQKDADGEPTQEAVPVGGEQR